ncbi:hypothetical protein [Tropicimonas sp. IMCC34011]|uniref:hypothetical protein n=1 Tax=Tropicimonas sp. IMCC34011 TaxID=2248759 RepID=UPI000E254681|nr:hypothetical protein [Tropicimonas sp. IMCC34011]
MPDVYRVHKTTALPVTLQGNSIYLVAPAGSPDYVEVYVTNSAGDATRHTPRAEDIQAMIDSAILGSLADPLGFLISGLTQTFEYHDFQRDPLFLTTNGQTLAGVSDPVGLAVDNRGGNNATQPTAAARPIRSAAGLDFNGSVQYLLSGITTSTAMTALVMVTVGSGSTQFALGVNQGSSDRFYLGTANGEVVWGVGNENTSDLTSGFDATGQTGVIWLTMDGSNIRGGWNGTELLNKGQVGAVQEGMTPAIGALRNQATGARGDHWNGPIRQMLICQEALMTEQVAAWSSYMGGL